MIFLYLILFSIILGILINVFGIKIISIIDYKILGLHNRSNSIFDIYGSIFKNKVVVIKILVLELIFIMFNSIILYKIIDNFNFSFLYLYLKYYYLFLIIYLLLVIDSLTTYIYTALSYPMIIISLLIFTLSFLEESNLKNNFNTLLLIMFFYIFIKKYKFLGDGDFDIILIVSLTLGLLPTVFIFYVSFLFSVFVSIFMVLRKSIYVKNNKITFIPFIFISTSIFIFLKI